MRRFPFHILFSLLLLLPLAACDSGGDGDGDGDGNPGTVGEFSATLGGDLDGTFSGNAFFSVVEDPDLPGGRSFVLIMTEANLTTGTQTLAEFVGIVRPGDRPGNGEYSIDIPEEGSEGTLAIYVNQTGQTSATSLAATSGSFTVTSSSSDRVEGTFSFSGDTFDPMNPQTQGTGSISGNFDAVFIDPDTIPNAGF